MEGAGPGLGFKRFRVEGLGFRVYSFWFMGFRVQG